MVPTSPQALAAALYEALAGGDKQRLSALLHPAFVGRTTAGLPFGLGGQYDGPDDMRRRFWGGIAKHFIATAIADDMRVLDDDRLLVHGRYVGQGRTGGADLTAAFMHLLSFREGRISALVQLTDSARWAQAGRESASARETEAVTLQVADGLATIRLNRPEAHNAIDTAFVEALYRAVHRCVDDRTVRAVLLLGNGKSFTVGGDLPYLAKAESPALPGLLRSMTGPYHEALRTLSRMDVPLVVAVQGAVAGGGLGLTYSGDIVLAADNSRFALGFSALGLSPDGGNSWFLPRLVGTRRAQELYFENRVLDAQEALDWGLVTRVVPLAELEAQALACATRLAHGPTLAFAETRRLFRDAGSATLSEQLGAETEALSRTAATEDAPAAIAAFTNKRPPVFRGV